LGPPASGPRGEGPLPALAACLDHPSRNDACEDRRLGLSPFPGQRMAVVRTLATHEVVQLVYPRPITERDELGIAVGHAIDSALSRYSHESVQGLRPTASSMNRFAAEDLAEQLSDVHRALSPEERGSVQGQIAAVLQAFRHSEVFGLRRPRTRLIVIDEAVGIYAQPDYWDGKSRFYEMKSYRAFPPHPDVALQLKMFQLAFPGFGAYLLSIDRRATPVTTLLSPIPPLTVEESSEVLRSALRWALERGIEKVLEYVDSPIVRYSTSTAR
jgi:hypothetical protein